jgi:hypothetical protein
MFFLDSMLIGGIRWALDKVVTAAEAEMNDDSALRDRLLEAEMQRELGEITDEEFAAIEAELLRAIREIKDRRDGGAGAFVVGEPIDTEPGGGFQVEAEVAGDFYGDAVNRSDRSDRSGRSEATEGPGKLAAGAGLRPVVADAEGPPTAAPQPAPAPRAGRTARTTRTARTIRTTRTKS